MVPHDQVSGRPANNGRRMEDDDNHGDFVPTAHKLEFPKFDDTSDPLPWLNWCERYFHIHRTPEH
jgi:hypothetical protein